tara:strand:+ start:324 stop:797 length:474 start_codon:yes stop_codon:yes gene_type:complete
VGKPKTKDFIVIKPIWWRQLGFTLFLFICSIYFAFMDFLGPIAGWIITVLVLVISILNFADQLLTWSRLRIDRDGFDLRTWWGRKKVPHQNIESIEWEEYMNRKLIILRLKSPVGDKEEKKEIPFPCAFGRPVDEVIKVLRDGLDKTPRRSLPKSKE